jgi:hypothetical protein
MANLGQKKLELASQFWPPQRFANVPHKKNAPRVNYSNICLIIGGSFVLSVSLITPQPFCVAGMTNLRVMCHVPSVSHRLLLQRSRMGHFFFFFWGHAGVSSRNEISRLLGFHLVAE